MRTLGSRNGAAAAAAAAAVVAAAVASMPGAKAECGNNVALCESSPIVLDTKQCMDQELSFSMEACCSADSLEANACSDPKKQHETCRIVEIQTPFSPSTDGCCAQLELSLDWTKTTQTCCKSCSCFGDPNCISFDDKVDSWIICDGRTRNENAVWGKELVCPIKQTACENQKDHLGNQCVYKANGLETVDANGSPCKSASSQPAEMVMYKIADFELILYLGDRGIIESIKLTSGANSYYMDAGACVHSQMPWRANPKDKNPPANPDWAPYSWHFTKKASGNLWHIAGLESEVTVDLRCLNNNKGSLPRINIDSLQDPKNNRKDASGVCATGVIDKQLSTWEKTPDMNKFCRSQRTEGEAIVEFCGSDFLTQKTKCLRTFCDKISTNDADRALCISDVNKYQNDPAQKNGWERVWCARNVLSTKNPADCTTGKCLQCMYDVYDFGWPEAIASWKNYNTEGGQGVDPDVGPCLHVAELNQTLSQCQNGVTIQYLDTDALDEDGDKTTCWKDFLAVPAGRKICEGKIVLSSLAGSRSDEVNFFDKLFRIKQCNADALCAESSFDKCSPEYGVTGTIKLNPYPVTNKGSLYWQLVREGKLVCKTPGCLEAEYGNQLNTAKCNGCKWCEA